MIALLVGICLGVALALPAISIDVERGVNVGEIAERAMVKTGFTLKQLALTCGYADSSTLSRAFHGLAPLDLWHLRHAPFSWWQMFLTDLMAAIIWRRFDDLTGDRRMAKAHITDNDERKRA